MDKAVDPAVNGRRYWPLWQCLQALRQGEVSAELLLDACQEAFADGHALINALPINDYETARLQARRADAARQCGEPLGPLHGIPFSIKESFDVQGWPTTCGDPAHAGQPVQHDADVVHRLREAGAILVGKSNVPLHLRDWQSYNAVYGTTRNPRDPSRTPGGSSGGSAAAVCAGMSVFDVGSDIGSSLRNPAHYCGVYSHKRGFGGESSLCMVLVTEMIRNPAHRGKYSGFTASSYSFGWGAAALAYAAMYALLPPEYAWRVCFFLGILPALVVVYLRRNLVEPEIYIAARSAAEKNPLKRDPLRVVKSPLLAKTVLCSLLSGGMLGGYYAIATWLPTYLKLERGLSVFGTSSYLVVMILGSFLGYVAGAYATDRLGRRATYVLFAVGAMAMALVYMMIPISNTSMLFLGFPMGILMQGMFSGIGATLSESYPSSVRATGYGVSYNAGRVIGSLFPLSVGWLSGGTLALGVSIAVVAGVGYALVIVSALMLPETNGLDLSRIEEDGSTPDDGLDMAPKGTASRIA